MPQRFSPKKDLKIGLLLFSPCLILLCIAVVEATLVSISVAILLLLLVLWVWFGTYYEIDGDSIVYRSGPFRGRIPIVDVREIQCHTYSWSGNRPVLSSDCLRFKCSSPPTPSRSYRRNYEVFIAPSIEEAFIKKIKEQKPDIVVSE